MLVRINCSRNYEVVVPENYSEEQIKHIVEHLPRMSEAEKNAQSKRATAMSATFKNKHVDGQVELDFSETVKLNWSDGSSSVVSLPHRDIEDDDSEVVDITVNDSED